MWYLLIADINDDSAPTIEGWWDTFDEAVLAVPGRVSQFLHGEESEEAKWCEDYVASSMRGAHTKFKGDETYIPLSEVAYELECRIALQRIKFSMREDEL